MLNFYGCVIGQLWKLGVERANHSECVSRSIEKVRISKRDVLCAAGNLAPYVSKDQIHRNDSELPLVNGHNRAVSAKVFAASAGLRKTHSPAAAVRHYQFGV